MKPLRLALRLGLLAGFSIGTLGFSARDQATSPNQARSPASGARKEGDEDEQRAKKLNERIDKAMKVDRWDEAVASAEELFALQARARGSKHFETVNAEWHLKAFRRLNRLSPEDRVAYQSTWTVSERAEALFAQGKYAEAQPLFENVLEIRRRLLTDEHPLTATGYGNVATNLNAQGKYARAQPLFEKALEIDRRLLTDEHPDTAQSYNDLAANLDDQGRYAEAQPLYEKALAVKRRLLTDNHPDTAQGYNNVAYNLNSQGKYAQAQSLYEKALEINRRVLTDDHPDTAATFGNLALNFNAQGNYAQAQPLFEKALEIYRRLLSDDHPYTAGSYNNLATNLEDQGKLTQAQPLLEKALEIRRRLLTDDHPSTATSYINVAYNLNAQGKYIEAQSLYEKALAIFRGLFTDDHPNTAISYNNLAYNLEAQGRYAQAQPLYEKSLEIRRRLLTDDHPDTPTAYNNLASNLGAQGNYERAEPLFEKALEIRRRLFGDDHASTAISYKNLALNLSAQGKYVEALDCWLRAAKTQDSARLRVAFTGLERAAGAGESSHSALAAVLARVGQPAAGWQSLEANLGRGLLDELAARGDRRLTPGERAHLRELTAELERLDRLMETTPANLERAERAKRFEDSRRQRELASIALGEFQANLVRNYGALAGEVARLSEIQVALPGDSALLAWVDIPPAGPNAADPDGEHWGVVVRSQGVPAWVPIAGTGPNGHWTKDDNALASRVRTELRTRPERGMANLQLLVERLRTQRIAPLATALGATADGVPPARTLIVLPSRAMAGIPVESILASDDTRTVSYAPSATVYKYLRDQPRRDRHAGLLAVGDPVYGRTGKFPQVIVAERGGAEEFEPLPGTRNEVEVLSRLFKSDDRPTRTLLATDANEPELDRLAASGELVRFGFIHLATHGVIDEAVPARSAVILTQTDLPDPLEQALNHKPVFDGRLSGREIQRGWELKAELVTLSACETALGREAGGEGFVGFTQALLMSGARSVCLSLWKVDDTATALLMQRFYQNLLGKRDGLSGPLSKAKALSEAKAWLRGLPIEQVASLTRSDPRKSLKGQPQLAVTRFDHPYYWAGFVLIGDPD
jgi:CHAT domain-containing protein/Flp pilus assembly protein TadD